jgi:hypothetical protein
MLRVSKRVFGDMQKRVYPTRGPMMLRYNVQRWSFTAVSSPKNVANRGSTHPPTSPHTTEGP